MFETFYCKSWQIELVNGHESHSKTHGPGVDFWPIPFVGFRDINVLDSRDDYRISSRISVTEQRPESIISKGSDRISVAESASKMVGTVGADFFLSFFFSCFFPNAWQGFPFHSGGLGVEGVCSLDVAFVVATVRNRPQPSATVRVRTVWPCLWEVLQRWSFLEVSDVWLLRFAWQAWHFVTFRRVLERVESRFA